MKIKGREGIIQKKIVFFSPMIFALKRPIRFYQTVLKRLNDIDQFVGAIVWLKKFQFLLL